MTASREVRVLALWRDDPTEAPLTVDLRVDARSGSVIGHWDVFGAFDLNGNSCRPFALREDGTMELGDDDHGKARRRRTNLRNILITVDAEFIVYWNEEDYGVYRIVKVATLGAKDSAA